MQRATLGFFLTLTLAPRVEAQAPRLDGHWTIAVKPPPTERVPPLCFLECEIAQTDKALTVKQRTSTERTYMLDGAPSTRTVEMAGYTSTITTTARWQQAVLVITNTITSVGQGDRSTSGSTTRVWLQDGRLIVEQTGTSPRDGEPIRAAYIQKPDH